VEPPVAHSESLDPPYPFVFEAARTPASSICADPCYQVRIYVEGHSFIYAIQMDLAVWAGARTAELPFYPETNSNADDGNVTFLPDPASGIDERVLFPWSFTAIARSPRPGFDALLLNEAIDSWSGPVSVESVEGYLRSIGPTCAPIETCQIIEDAVARDRIYLGRFNVTRANDPHAPDFAVRLDGVVVAGGSVESLAQRSRNLGSSRRSGARGAFAFLLYLREVRLSAPVAQLDRASGF
jgi:hypothetical protein